MIMNIKKIGAWLTAATLFAGMIPGVSAATKNPTYSQQYVEDFESADLDEVFGANGILSMNNTAQSDSIKIVQDENSKNHYLSIESGTAVGSSNYDVQVNTKANLFKNDVTFVDMRINSPNAKTATSGFPGIKVYDTTRVDGKFMINNYAFRYLKENAPRWYNIADQNQHNEDLPYLATTWYDLRLVFDKTNKTITTSVRGSSSERTATFTNEWSDNICLIFQVATGATLNIDDISISDGFYQTDYFLNQDFEHAGSNAYTMVNANNYFPGLLKTVNYSTVYDKNINTTYASLPAGITLYTRENMTVGTDRPIVIEFTLKTDETSNVTVCTRRTDGWKPAIFTIASGKVTQGSKTVDVSDGDYHTYRATIVYNGSGYSISKLVDNVWIGNDAWTADKNGTFRADIVNSGSNAIGLDNYKIYYPASAQLKFALADRTDVDIDETIELVANTPINYSSATKITLTADGEEKTFTTVPNLQANTMTINPDGGIQPGTTYVMNLGGFKDMFDQTYGLNQEYTFTTKELDPIETEFTYTIDGNNMSAGKFTAGTMAAAVSVRANTSAGAAVNTYVAQYDASGALTDVALLPVTIEGQGQDAAAESIQIPATTQKIKVMTWDKEQAVIKPVQELLPYSFNTIESVEPYYPGYTKKAVTFSYDDGLPNGDPALIALFNKYHLKGTFNLIGSYIPTEEAALASYVQMYKGHEVANHSQTHPKFNENGMTVTEAIKDITDGRDTIKTNFGDDFNTEKWGFIWPYTRPTDRGEAFITSLEQNIKDAGAVYIRPVSTTGEFDLPTDWFLWEPTSKDDNMAEYTDKFLADNEEGLRLLYLWGHASDLASKKYGVDFTDLETTFQKLTAEDVNIWSATNMEIYDYVHAVEGITLSEDKTKAINDSDVDVYAVINGQRMVIPAHGYAAL